MALYTSALMTAGPVVSEIEVRHCTTIDEYEQCVRIVRTVWGPELAEPTGMFVVAHHTGGQTFAAFVGSKMVGFTLAIAATRGGKIFLHSHQTAVLPEYRDRGIGRKLKLFQRDDALRRDIDLVEWTFDPLELKNAYFNLARLGAVARRWIPNFYGITDSPLHSGIPTDRLVAEWWLESTRVKATLEGDPLAESSSGERVSLPSNIAQVKAENPEAAVRIQTALRERMQLAFSRGLVATSIESSEGGTNYVLEDRSRIAGLTLAEFR